MTIQRKRTHALVFTIVAAVACAGACGDKGEGSGSGTGGDGGALGGNGGADATAALELVSHAPSDDAENVDAQEPIVLLFNAELDQDTVSSALRVRSAGKEVPITTEVVGKEIRIQLDSVPALPASVSVAVGPSLRGKQGQEFVGDSFTFSLPLWFRDTGLNSDGDSGLYARALSYALVGGVDAGRLVVRKHLAMEDLEVPAPTEASDVVAIVGSSTKKDSVTIAWLAGKSSDRSLSVATFDGSDWTEAEILSSGADLVAVASQVEDRLVLAAGTISETGWGMGGASGSTSGTLSVWAQAADGTFSEAAQSLALPGDATSEFAVSLDGSGNAMLVVGTHSKLLRVYRQKNSSFEELGTISRTQSTTPIRPSIAANGTTVWVGFEDGDAVSSHAYLAYEQGGSFYKLPALDVDLDGDASRVVLSGDGTDLFVGWYEYYAPNSRVFVGKVENGKVAILAQEGLSDLPNAPGNLALNVDAMGQPSLAYASSGKVLVARFNGSPTLPPALIIGERGGCNIPADGTNFPTTLKATGCYKDLATQQLVSAAIPYTLNSPLWSDGALKHRYVLLPDGQSAVFNDKSGFKTPVGTIIIKEFYLEAEVGDPSTIFPVETRFLVHRCDEDQAACLQPWQGYSYQWNSTATDGTLLTNTGATPLEVEWTVKDGGSTKQHTHIYPGRTQCLECHSEGAGFLLGIDAPQLDRPLDYGDYVDNQLHAWLQSGAFGDSAEAADIEGVVRMPSPADVGRTLTDRALGYLDSNCSHCHQPGGKCSQVGMDLRYFGPGLEPANICDKLDLSVATDSLLFEVQNTRTAGGDVAVPMPQIASNLVDQRSMPLMEAWIAEVIAGSSCAP